MTDSDTPREPYKVLSLFAGIGAFDLGLERAGHRVVRQIESDSDCQRILRKQWPDVRLDDDVTTAT
jgi:DNA (cytosine-5)-methyltransferase 1